jgi:hypothetical protein
MMRWNWFEAPSSGTYMYGWVIVSGQLYFHIYYLFVVDSTKICITNVKLKRRNYNTQYIDTAFKYAPKELLLQYY